MFSWINKQIRKAGFIHPIVNEQLSNAIDHKIAANEKETRAKVNFHNEYLKELLSTLISKNYNTSGDFQIAYEYLNKQWIDYAKKVNSTEKMLNLKRNAFSESFKLIIKNKNNGKK